MLERNGLAVPLMAHRHKHFKFRFFLSLMNSAHIRDGFIEPWHNMPFKFELPLHLIRALLIGLVRMAY